ncbi:hypothetical protein KA005_76175, partial [bacterium]|nr:hypothetical protein [bacterium]
FAGVEVEGVYTWEFWYKDTVTGKVLGKDVQGYEFSKTPPSPVDIIPPFISIINPLDGTTIFKDDNILIYGIAFDPSGIETLTINNENVISYQAFGVVPFFTFVNLNEGLNEVTISARDSSENYNEITERIIVNYYPFNVRLNSPNNMDRYTPDDSISFTGEVIGGIPPFTFKWIINDVEYPESSDSREYTLNKRLSSDNYRVKLEVVDSNEYSIETDEIVIDVSPLNVGTTFLVNPDGYQFENFKQDKLSWELFRNTYGTYVDNSDIAREFYNTKYSKSSEDGSCFGMSASSLALYRNNHRAWDLAEESTLPFFGRNRDLDSEDIFNNLVTIDYNDNGIWDPAPRTWGIFPPFISTPTDWVGYYSGRWDYPAITEDVTNNGQFGANNAYNSIKRRMVSNNWINNPMVISYWWWSEPYTDENGNGRFDEGEAFDDKNKNNKLDDSGHAVVPYRIEDGKNHGYAKVFVYDSNDPENDNLYILFNLRANEVFPTMDDDADKYVGDHDNYFKINAHPIIAVSLDAIELKPDAIPNEESISNTGHLLYTDTPGNHLGYLNGEFKNEISGAYRILDTPGQNGLIDSSEIYLITDLNLKREIYGLKDGVATVSAFKPNSLVIAELQVSSASIDELVIPKDGSSVEFISGEGTSSLSLMVEREKTGLAHVVHMSGSDIESGKGIQLLLSDDLDKVGIINKGLQKGFDVYLEQIGSNPSSYNSLRQIIVEENSAVWITPLDWNDIDDNAILIEYDSGNDGTIESNEMINTYNITFLPPVTTMDQFNLT